METLQPNFEKVKTKFYRAFVNSEKADFSILSQALTGEPLPSFNNRKEDFKREFNHWLNTLDIRCAGQLIDAMVSQKIKLSGWMRNKNYTIEYNQNDVLDLIINTK